MVGAACDALRCVGELVKIGEHVRETLDCKPVTFFVRRHARNSRSQRDSTSEDHDDGSRIATPLPSNTSTGNRL